MTQKTYRITLNLSVDVNEDAPWPDSESDCDVEWIKMLSKVRGIMECFDVIKAIPHNKLKKAGGTCQIHDVSGSHIASYALLKGIK